MMKIQQSPCLSGFICFRKINERAVKGIAAVQNIRVILERKRARIDYDHKPETYKWEDIPAPLRSLKLKPRWYG